MPSLPIELAVAEPLKANEKRPVHDSQKKGNRAPAYIPTDCAWLMHAGGALGVYRCDRALRLADHPPSGSPSRQRINTHRSH